MGSADHAARERLLRRAIGLRTRMDAAVAKHAALQLELSAATERGQAEGDGRAAGAAGVQPGAADQAAERAAARASGTKPGASAAQTAWASPEAGSEQASPARGPHLADVFGSSDDDAPGPSHRQAGWHADPPPSARRAQTNSRSPSPAAAEPADASAAQRAGGPKFRDPAAPKHNRGFNPDQLRATAQVTQQNAILQLDLHRMVQFCMRN